jgi:NTP pyrophosphatase (non-canonical NTP hydrolase)
VERETAFDLIDNSRNIADQQWGANTIGLDNPLSAAILLEEAGEVARAVLEQDSESVLQELVDLAQVAVAWIESLPEELARA